MHTSATRRKLSIGHLRPPHSFSLIALQRTTLQDADDEDAPFWQRLSAHKQTRSDDEQDGADHTHPHSQHLRSPAQHELHRRPASVGGEGSWSSAGARGTGVDSAAQGGGKRPQTSAMFRPPAHAVTLELSSTLDVPPFPPDGWGGELLDRSLRDAALDEIARTQARLLH